MNFQSVHRVVEPVHVEAEVKLLREAAVQRPPHGQEVATTPEESAFEGAARWSIRVPDVNRRGGQVLLRIAYQGDIAESTRRPADHRRFLPRRPWEIGYRHSGRRPATGLELQILPCGRCAIYLQ